MLSTHCHQTLHWRRRTPLSYSSQKLAALKLETGSGIHFRFTRFLNELCLGESNSMISILELRVLGDCLTDHLNLFVNRFQKSINCVVNDRVANFERMNVAFCLLFIVIRHSNNYCDNELNYPLNDLLNATHA